MTGHNAITPMTNDDLLRIRRLAQLCVDGDETRDKPVDFVFNLLKARNRFGDAANLSNRQRKFMRDLEIMHGMKKPAPPCIACPPNVVEYTPTPARVSSRPASMPRWSKIEEDTLIEEIAQHGLRGLTTASEILGRSWGSCRAKYRHLIGESR